MFRRFFVLTLCLVTLAQAYGFKYYYKGVTFDCKPHKGNTVTIKGFDMRARKVVIPSKVTDSGKTYTVKTIDTFSAFEVLSVESIVIEEGIVEIEKRAFYNCKKLKTVTLPSTLLMIGKDAFKNMRDPSGISIPSEEIKGLLVISGLDLPENTEYIMPTNTVSAPLGTPMIEVVSFTKTGNSLGARVNQRIDNSGRLCALVKVVLAGYKANYSGDFIPEPYLNYIAYNKEGKDYVWLVNNARSINVYSDEKQFEPKTIVFGNVNRNIPYLESGCVYELLIRIVHK